MNQIILGDCLYILKLLGDNSVDSIVTDPPYHLTSIVKRFGKKGSAPAKEGKDGSFKRLSGGFMGKTWDGTDENGNGIAYNVDMWKECLRVLKPGGYLLSFGGTRTYHRMAVAIEDAGFEVRDMINWCYGSGFPKSLNIGNAVDKLQGNKREKLGTKYELLKQGSKPGTFGDRHEGYQRPWQKNKNSEAYFVTKGTSEWEGWGTALKPAHEPICMARKPLTEKTVAKNCLKWGTGGINIDESRVGTSDDIPSRKADNNVKYKNVGQNYSIGIRNEFTPTQGRFPANLILSDSEEVRECFPETKGMASQVDTKETPSNYFGAHKKAGYRYGRGDQGNASRFFKSIIYQAKASKSERNKGCEELEEKAKVFNGQSDKPSEDMKDVEKRFTTLPKANNHPTVKPIALMEYLIKMVTPKGGVVLDPFAGSGTTLVAAKQNGFKYIGIELTEEYIPIIEARLSAVKTLEDYDVRSK